VVVEKNAETAERFLQLIYRHGCFISDNFEKIKYIDPYLLKPDSVLFCVQMYPDQPAVISIA
jgi:hypothetical protein